MFKKKYFNTNPKTQEPKIPKTLFFLDEINRTDSSGPDISRLKYTGQEEDKETGLMYYKARYYDPALGRFLQADSEVHPSSTFGMNRYMYVDANPVRFGDSSGNKKDNAVLGAIAGYYFAESMGLSKEQGALIGGAIGGGKTNVGKNMSKPFATAFKNAADTFNRATGQDYERRIRNKTGKYEQCPPGPIWAGCIIGKGLYEAGARGFYEPIDNAIEIVSGVLSAVGTYFLGTKYLYSIPEAYTFKGEDGVNFFTSNPVALFIIIAQQIMKSGHRLFKRNERHRGRIKSASCGFLLANALSNSNIDRGTLAVASAGGGFLCDDKYGYEE